MQPFGMVGDTSRHQVLFGMVGEIFVIKGIFVIIIEFTYLSILHLDIKVILPALWYQSVRNNFTGKNKIK